MHHRDRANATLPIRGGDTHAKARAQRSHLPGASVPADAATCALPSFGPGRNAVGRQHIRASRRAVPNGSPSLALTSRSGPRGCQVYIGDRDPATVAIRLDVSTPSRLSSCSHGSTGPQFRPGAGRSGPGVVLRSRLRRDVPGFHRPETRNRWSWPGWISTPGSVRLRRELARRTGVPSGPDPQLLTLLNA
jgi:hypothetical protein